ncbi:MAG: hypothetical protein Q9M20_02260, partial [Mariprofundaceae bacterium]|nr:hypothetical protein [Mariprofundaceae bacterium]
PGTYRIDVTDAFGELFGYALTTANQPMTPVVATAGMIYPNHFGYFKAPNIAVTKTMASSTLDVGSKMDVTLTVSNTGGGVANFKIADVMPASTAPTSPFGGAGVFLVSDPAGPIDFEFSQLLSIKLNGVPLTLGVDYHGAAAASITPTWTLPGGLPGNATLEIHFTGVQTGGAGNTGSPNYNGASIQYGPAAALTSVDYPNLVTFAVAKDLTFEKRVSAINAIPYTGTGRPVIHPGDTVTFQLAVANTLRGRQIDASSFTDTLPVDLYANGLTYVLGTSILTNPLGGLPPAIVADPLITPAGLPGTGIGQILAWPLVPLVAPAVLASTNASFPSEVIMQFDAYASPLYLPGTYLNQGAAMAARTGRAATLVNASRDFDLTYDLTLTKTVNKSSVAPGGRVAYTVNITNNGVGAIAGLKLVDQLDNGFKYVTGTSTFDNAPTADPVGTLTQPVWQLPMLSGVTTLALSFSADTYSWTPIGVHTNTATIKDVRDVSVITTGPTAPVDVIPQPFLVVVKVADVTTALPGSTIIYTVTTSNTGLGVAINVEAIDALSAFVALATDPWGNGTPIQFTDGVNTSGLTIGGIAYSNNAGSTYVYVLNTALPFDPNVTNFKVQMNGIMNANTAANPSFELKYQVQVQ